MIDITPYSENDLGALHKALCAAFGDYLLPMQPTFEQFRFMLRQRGFDPALTWIARSHGRIVGFWIMASNDSASPRAAYTVATGTVPEHRGRGLSGKIFEAMLSDHKLKGVENLELEVIDENMSARRTYNKLGFAPDRGVTCYTLPPQKKGPDESEAIAVKPLSLDIIETSARALWDWSPTWQNSLAALRRIEGAIEIKGVYDGDGLQGYGVVIRPTVKLAQIAVHQNHRRKGLGQHILSALIASAGSGGLQVINADGGDEGFAGFMAKNGGEAGTRQIVLSRRL